MPVWSGGRLEALAVWATAPNPFADQQDKEHHREEAKDVVEALQPHGRHDEVSSMNTAPNGRMPPMIIVESKLRYHAWWGTNHGKCVGGWLGRGNGPRHDVMGRVSGMRGSVEWVGRQGKARLCRRMPRRHLAWNDARDHVGLHRRVLELTPVAEPHANPHERERDQKPDA